MIITVFNLAILILFLILLHILKRKQIPLGFRVLLSLAFGVGYGLLLTLSPENGLHHGIKNILYLIGNGYLALLKMLVIPLILTSIINAILTIGSNSGANIKKISFISCAMLLSMTAISSLIGIVIGKLFDVGQGLKLPFITEMPKHPYKGLVDMLLGMLPSNPIAIMMQENTIAVVIFAVLLAMAAHRLDKKDHDKRDAFKQFIAVLFEIIKKLAVIILNLTPYGILALISLLLLDQGLELLTGMLNFIAAMYTAMAIVMLMHTLILAFIGQHPWRYFKKAYLPLFVAFTTRSSFGTLPITEETLRDKFKTSEVVSAFVPSIGATIGMNACAGIFPAMLVVMTLTILHQPLTMDLVLLVMFINAIASLGISGIPGTAYIAATITLTSLNLPYAIIGLVQGIDPIIDMGRTATNVNGVMATSLVVDYIEKRSSDFDVIPAQVDLS